MQSVHSERENNQPGHPVKRQGTRLLYSVHQSWARDNIAATTWLCCKAKNLFIIALRIYLVWLLHLDTKILKLFVFFLVPNAQLRCRVVAHGRCCDAKNWRVPSSSVSRCLPWVRMSVRGRWLNYSGWRRVRALVLVAIQYTHTAIVSPAPEFKFFIEK